MMFIKISLTYVHSILKKVVVIRFSDKPFMTNGISLKMRQRSRSIIKQKNKKQIVTTNGVNIIACVRLLTWFALNKISISKISLHKY